MYIKTIFKIFAKIVLFVAHTGAGSASLWNLYEPKLPEQLEK